MERDKSGMTSGMTDKLRASTSCKKFFVHVYTLLIKINTFLVLTYTTMADRAKLQREEEKNADYLCTR